MQDTLEKLDEEIKKCDESGDVGRKGKLIKIRIGHRDAMMNLTASYGQSNSGITPSGIKDQALIMGGCGFFLIAPVP